MQNMKEKIQQIKFLNPEASWGLASLFFISKDIVKKYLPKGYILNILNIYNFKHSG